VRAWGTERLLKKARQSQKTNTALRGCDRNSAAQNDVTGNEAGTVMCQLLIVATGLRFIWGLKPLLLFQLMHTILKSWKY
jgi:hypothetical protein